MERRCGQCCKLEKVGQTELGIICCIRCGAVLADAHEPGSVVNDNALTSDFPDSIQTRLNYAYGLLSEMVDQLGFCDAHQILVPAQGFFRIAFDYDFLEGRQPVFVAALCLYVACRVHKRPFFLFDFASFLNADVYALGVILVDLIQLLHLEDHASVMQPVDPSLFIHRFVADLLGASSWEVERTALKIVTGFKFDWMQSGTNPSRVCAEAVYLAALVHGFQFSKGEFAKLSLEDYEHKTKQLEVHGNNYKEGELLCQHNRVAHFAHGLCRACYDHFVTISRGLVDGLNRNASAHADSEILTLSETKGSGVHDGNEALERLDSADYIVTECDDESRPVSDVADAEFEIRTRHFTKGKTFPTSTKDRRATPTH